jgi:Na+/melibiose symporter-like transporter
MRWRNSAFALFFALGGVVLCAAGIALLVILIGEMSRGQGFDVLAFLCAVVGLVIGVVAIALSREAWKQAIGRRESLRHGRNDAR